MKKIIFLVALLSCFTFAGCGDSSNENENENKKDKSTLVVYFSATGTTKKIASMIASYLDAEEYEIVPSLPYTSEDLNYSNSSSRTSIENSDDVVRPEISNLISSIAEYDVIYLGYPIWWGKAPKIIHTFLEAFDFSNKTIIPFATSGSSGISGSESILHNIADNATWLEGERFSSSTKQPSVSSWIDDLEY